MSEMKLIDVITGGMKQTVPLYIAWGNLLQGFYPDIPADKLGLAMLSIIASAAIGASKCDFDEIAQIAKKINEDSKRTGSGKSF